MNVAPDGPDYECPRSAEEVYPDFCAYEKDLRIKRRDNLTASIAKLRTENRTRHAVFIGMLDEGRARELPIMDYETFANWWSSLDEEKQRAWDGIYRAFREDQTSLPPLNHSC